MNNTTKFETGATSHAVNDLILFTDNTKELAELKDKIYRRVIETQHLYPGSTHPDMVRVPRVDINTSFKVLYKKAAKKYIQELPIDNDHIKAMTSDEIREYMNLYISDFENWKSEHGYK